MPEIGEGTMAERVRRAAAAGPAVNGWSGSGGVAHEKEGEEERDGKRARGERNERWVGLLSLTSWPWPNMTILAPHTLIT